jgi:D-glycero-alpha-D-manno-heptose-7-phosphate kinase
MVITRTPYRVSFFGGGTDYPAWYREHGGQVLSTTIDKFIYVSCRYLPPFHEHRYRVVYSSMESCFNVSEIKHPTVREVLNQFQINHGLELHYDGDLPARSGMGSSSAFCVGLIKTLSTYLGLSLSKSALARQAIEIEQVTLGENVGSQDQTSAAYGGFNHITFGTDDDIEITSVGKKQQLATLNNHLMMFYTGIARTADQVAASYSQAPSRNYDRLQTMSNFVPRAVELVEGRGPIQEFGELLHESWKLKRGLSDVVSNSQIDEWYSTAREAGAVGGKLVGAGAGGMLVFFVSPDRQRDVREALEGLVHVPFEFSKSGAEIIFQDTQKRYDEVDVRPIKLWTENQFD